MLMNPITELQRRVTPAVMAQMTAIKLGDGNLADLYNEWVTAGESLGVNEQERDQLSATARTGENAIELDRRGARRQWVETVETLENIANLMKLDDKRRAMLLGPLEKKIAEAQARRRADANADADTDADTDAGTDADADAGDDTGDTDADAGDADAGDTGDAPANTDDAPAPDDPGES